MSVIGNALLFPANSVTRDAFTLQYGPPSYNSTTGVFTVPKYLTDLVNNVDPAYQLIRGAQTVTLDTNGFLKIPSVITTSSNDTSVFINTVSSQLNYSYNWEFNHFGGKFIIPGGASIVPLGSAFMPSGLGINVESPNQNSYYSQDKDKFLLITGSSDLSNRASLYLYGPNDSVGTPYISIQVGSSGDIKSWQFRHSGAIRFPDNTEQTTAWVPATSLAGYATETFVNTAVSNLVASAPAALNTLNELAAALGNDANYSTTISTALGNRLRVDVNNQGLTTQQKTNALTNLGIYELSNLKTTTYLSKNWTGGTYYGLGIQVLGNDEQINFTRSQWHTQNGGRAWLDAEVLSAPIGTKFLIDQVSTITITSAFTTTDNDNYTANITTDVPIFYTSINSIIKLSDSALTYSNSTGMLNLNLNSISSSYIPEGNNLYFTDSRARAAISAGTGITYNNTTGVISSSITQYTDALARAAHSFTAGSGGYNSSTGVITIPTNTNHLTNGAGFITSSALTGYATETFVNTTVNTAVNTAVSNLVASAPAALDTLNELAAALGNDANYSTTVSTALSNRLRVDVNTQALTSTQKLNAVTNLGLATVATSGNYTDLLNTPYINNFTDAKARAAFAYQAGAGYYDSATGMFTIPRNTSHLTNDSGYISGTSPIITTPILNDVVTRKSSSTTNFKVVDEYVKLVSGTGTNSASPVLLDSFNISNYRTVKYLIEVSQVHPQGSTVVELVEVSVAVQAGSGYYGVYINSVTLVHVMDYFLAQFNAVIDDTNTYVTLTATTNGNTGSATNFRILATGFRRLTS